jgi:hypothetical protein
MTGLLAATGVERRLYESVRSSFRLFAQALWFSHHITRQTAVYYFKILKGQGPAAANGAIDYVIEGIMIGGFALVAVPAEHRVTGVKTFIVNYDGVVYQKELGPDSLNIVKNMELYNPDKTWQPTDDRWPQIVAVAAP